MIICIGLCFNYYYLYSYNKFMYLLSFFIIVHYSILSLFKFLIVLFYFLDFFFNFNFLFHSDASNQAKDLGRRGTGTLYSNGKICCYYIFRAPLFFLGGCVILWGGGRNICFRWGLPTFNSSGFWLFSCAFYVNVHVKYFYWCQWSFWLFSCAFYVNVHVKYSHFQLFWVLQVWVLIKWFVTNHLQNNKTLQ